MQIKAYKRLGGVALQTKQGLGGVALQTKQGLGGVALQTKGGGVADKGGWRCRHKPKIGSSLDLENRGCYKILTHPPSGK